jgi:hypothetical protein
MRKGGRGMVEGWITKEGQESKRRTEEERFRKYNHKGKMARRCGSQPYDLIHRPLKGL